MTWSKLAKACSQEKWDVALKLVRKHGHPVDMCDPGDGATALHEMCYGGRIQATIFLIRTLGANPHAVTTCGDTVLHTACQEGHTELVRILVRDFRLNVNAVNQSGATPLLKASLRGHTGTALLLINDFGASVDAMAEDGSTALMQAASFGRTGTALALINLGGARIDATDKYGATPLHWACEFGNHLTVSALLAEGARQNVLDNDGRTPQQIICLSPTADPQAKPLALAAFVRHVQMEKLGNEVLRLAGTWDHYSLQRAIHALMAKAAEPWALSSALAEAAKEEFWTAPRHPLDMFRDPATGRTALAVASAAGIFRNAELLIQVAASPLELDCGGQTPWQLALARGSDLMATWFESMPIVYWAGHSKLRYRPAATAFLLCCRFSRMRAPAVPPADEAYPIPGVSYMHPDDWCIPRRDAYRILHFLGPELHGTVWPGPPKGYSSRMACACGRRACDALPGRSVRPVRRVPNALLKAALLPAALIPAACCAQCGETEGKLMECMRCRSAHYCSKRCQKQHYSVHKAGCRAAGRQADVAKAALDASTVL
jgi:ankyrin repeat protein